MVIVSFGNAGGKRNKGKAILLFLNSGFSHHVAVGRWS